MSAHPQGGHGGLSDELLRVAQAIPNGIDERAHMDIEDRRSILCQLLQDQSCGIPPGLAFVTQPVYCSPHLLQAGRHQGGPAKQVMALAL